jgi:hypothetical protein
MGDLLIKLPDGSSEAQLSLKNGNLIEYKTVSIDELISNLISDFKFSTGILPNNTRFFSGTSIDYIIGIETPPIKRIFYKKSKESGKVKIYIPFPICIFIFHVIKEKVCDSKLFSLKNTLMRDKDILCRFPFGNTFTDGRICWGSNKLPKICIPMNLVSCIATFFDASFNWDLFDDQTISGKNWDFWKLIKELDEKESFPQEMLRQGNTNISKFMR